VDAAHVVHPGLIPVLVAGESVDEHKREGVEGTDGGEVEGQVER